MSFFPVSLFASLMWFAWCGAGQSPSASPAGQKTALPDAATMLREVEAHQKQLDKVRENYTFRAVQTVRQLDSSGNTKKVETEDHEVFFVNGHQVQKLVRKDGKDLSPDQARKEQDRVNKEVLKISKPGYVNPDKDEITVARLLQIVTFSKPRRVRLNERDTIVFDFAGDQSISHIIKARTTVFGRNGGAKQTHITHLAENRRIGLFFAKSHQHARFKLVARIGLRCLADHAFVV